MQRRIFYLTTIIAIAGCACSMGGEPAAAEANNVSVLQMLQLGYEFSPVITVIFGILAFATLFLIFHLLLSTRETLVVPGPLFRGLLDDVASGDIEAAQRRAEENPALFGRLVLPGLKLHGHPDRIHQAMEGAGRRTVGFLRQEANFLANIGVLSPMLGLLGTVLGLMRGFNILKSEEFVQGSKSVLLQYSVGQAMTTTAMGLMIGIPAMAAYYLCLSRVNRVSDDLEIAAEEVIAALGENKEQGKSQAVVAGESE